MKNTTKMFRALLLALALVVCMCMLFTSCDDSDPTTDSSTPTSDSQSTDSSNPGTTDSSVPGSTGTPDGGTTDSSVPGTTDSSVPGSTDSSVPGTTDSSVPGSTDSSVPGTDIPDVPCEHEGGTATCQAKAVCTKCGEEYGEFADHELTSGETIAPTCEADGYTVYACENCEYTENKDTVPALGGECDWYFVEYSAEDRPVCGVKGGTEIYTCAVCEASKEVVQEEVHFFYCKMYVVEGKEPTCTEAGYAWYECMSCSEGIERKIPAEHTYEAPTDYVAATCTTNGSQTWTCTVCGNVTVEEIVSNGHNFKYQYDETTATCTEAGVEIYGCWNCQEKIEIEVDAYGHEWSLDSDSLNLDTHTISMTCDTCSVSEAVSSYGLQEDPIVFTVPGEFVANVEAEWVYYTFTQNAEGYLSFVFDTDNVNVMVKEINYKYDTQFFWGGETEYKAEIFGDGEYIIAICSNDGEAVDIAVATEFEAADIPNAGETADKAIEIEGDNTAYYSTGKVWYTYSYAPVGATISFTINGDATVSYGVDPENLAVYENAFVEETGDTTYYIVVESTEEVNIVVNLEFPVGSMDNPFEIVDGENNINYAGGNSYYATFMSEQNGTLTLTFDAQVNIVYGTHPYMMYTSIVDGAATIDVSAWTTVYFGITTDDWSAVDFTITASFEAASVEEPSEPEVQIGEVIDSMEVETTDNYGYFDEYTFTATAAGQYTFFVPAGLGFWNSAEFEANPFGGPSIDYYDNQAGYYVTVDLDAGEEYAFFIAAETKETWTIDVYYYSDEPVIEYNDEFNGIYVDNSQEPSLKFVFDNGTLVVEDNTGYFNIGGTYTYGYNAELGEFSLDTEAFTLKVSFGMLLLGGRTPLVEYKLPTQAVIGNNSVDLVCVNYRYNDEKYTFTATEAGTYVISAAEGEMNLCVTVEGAYDAGMVDVPYEFTLEAGETFEFIVSSCANVMTTTEDTVDFVISVKE